MRVEKMGSKSDMFVKLVLVFFISLLSFAIGTFVGKKYSDNQHKLALLEPGSKGHDAHARSVASEATHEEEASTDEPKKADHAAAKSEKGVALTDAEIAKLAEEFVQDEQPPVALDKDHASGHEAGHDKKESARETASVAEKEQESAAGVKGEHGAAATSSKNEKLDKIVEKMKATESSTSESANTHAASSATAHTNTHGTKSTSAKAQKASEKVSEIAEQVAKEKILNEKVRTPDKTAINQLPKEVVHASVGKFTVQIASHTDEMDAKRLAEELKKKGYAAFYVPANIKGQTYYRVSVGLFSTQKEAQDYRAELVEKANVGSAFVQKIIQ